MDDFTNSEDGLVAMLGRVIRVAVRALAILMTLVIFWGVGDVGWVLYQKLIAPPVMMLTISDILQTFGAFMAVLIAIEIFVNIQIYLEKDVIHVKIVMATALMAIARKVIILDYKEITPEYIYGTAAVVLAMSIGYWLIVKQAGEAGAVVTIERPMTRARPAPENAAEQQDAGNRRERGQ